ncbi:carboxylesterase family protein [Polychaeton citri CBS 116435]|uniref:Carboxylic ester hydrolase n=1 Tax=Polychaeton citri CBS 116435 TaxID=1314669 RepID=A0A9P4UQB6_9PEZI|nr:carboxylesterase family protein [Polychaeton citri CBS 116435]
MFWTWATPALVGFLHITSAAVINADSNGKEGPTVHVTNGTYQGRYEPSYNTDYFLGIPYAQPPTGDLRFRVPRSLDTAWKGTRNATEYSPECYGYGLDTLSQGNHVSEDCLTLNVVKPRGVGDHLPVLVWIHGGGFVMGGSADNRYNQSFIVQQSVKAGMPIIAISINYRLSAWGFLYGTEIQETGQTMLGLRDQRLALRWIQENIAAFGGDPTRVTIQGESAGGFSVGAQLLAYDGRDDGLFSGAISESGAPVSLDPYPTVEDWDYVIAKISAETGCSNSTSVLDCLRELPADKLNDVINSTATDGASYGAVIDGDWFTQSAAEQLEKGDFVKVPYIIGCNADEGTSFGPYGINTTPQFLDYLADQGIDNATAQDLAILYPDIPAIGNPSTLDGRPQGELTGIGLQWKRTSSLVGDTKMNEPRRLTAHWWAEYGATAYSYVFDVLVNGVQFWQGSPHFQEVAFVFYNTEGLGYPQNGNPNPLGGVENPAYLKLAKQMVRMWISFVNFGDPNKRLGATWPAYDTSDPRYYAFNQNTTSKAKPDLFRAAGMAYIGELIMARKGTNCTGITACGSSYDGDIASISR